MERVVVVGAGMAGLRTVAALREQGYGGALTLVGAEKHRPYDRPPLSKDVLHGVTDDPSLEGAWDDWDIEERYGAAATGLGDGVLHTEAGDLDFDALVVATGSDPIRFPGTEPARTLRTVDDALALRASLQPGKRLVIVGAGWIGAEVATAATKAGAHVTVVEALDAPLANALPADFARRMLPWWEPVDLLLGEVVASVEQDAVELRSGRRLPAEVVLLGVGARPATGWLRSSGVTLTERGAVEVDAQLRSAVDGVYAVGDAAAWESARYGGRMHVEHWDNALHAPATLAASMLGQDVAWDPVPYFWSEQWGHMVQYAGHHAGADRVVLREDDHSWAALWLSGDALVAALTADRPRDLVQARRLMESGTAVDPDVLADPAAPVKGAALV